MKHLDDRHCWLQEELRKENYKVKRVDRKFNASDMLTQSLRNRTAKNPSLDWLSHNDRQFRKKLQCSRDDTETDAFSPNHSIPCEHDGRKARKKRRRFLTNDG